MVIAMSVMQTMSMIGLSFGVMLMMLKKMSSFVSCSG